MSLDDALNYAVEKADQAAKKLAAAKEKQRQEELVKKTSPLPASPKK